MFHAPWSEQNAGKPCSAPPDAAQAVAEAGAAARICSADEPGADPAHPAKASRERPTLRARLAARLATIDLAAIDIAPDLGTNIGSARWCRGVITLIGLTVLALSFWPDFTAPRPASPMRLDDERRDEFRSHMIMPLALGADSGRHMPPTELVNPLKSAPERPEINLLATLARGDSFSRMLRRAGLGDADIQRTSALVSTVVPTDEIAPGTQVDITLGRRSAPGTARVLQALSFRARFDMALVVEREGDTLRLARKPIAVDSTPLRIRGTIGNSLYRSARAAGAPASAVQAYLETMGERFDLDQTVRSGDSFDIIMEYRRAATGEAKAGRLLYAGLSRDGKPRAQLMRWGKNGQFYEASGIGQQRSGLLAPVNGPIGSRYGMRRHPILGYMRMHRGLDYRAGYGQPIVAVTEGRVLSAGRAGGCGNAVKLAHSGGLATRYCHMSRMAVRAGQGVRRGQVIGYVGSTGLSTGPHLHYEMYRHGRPINPQSVRYVTRAQLGGGELAAFRAQLKRLQALTPGAALRPMAQQAMENRAPRREIEKLSDVRKIAMHPNTKGAANP